MYVRDLAASMLRRWYFLVVAIAMTAGVAYVASTSIPPTYRTEASVVLIPPKSAEDPTANRFLALSGLSQAVDVLSRALNSDETHELVGRQAPAGTFEVVKDGATSAPVLVISVEAASAVEADALVSTVLSQVPVSLAELQAALSIPQGAEITSIQIDRDDKPVLSQKSRLRAIAALTILCLGGSILLIGALDGLLLARSAKKQRSSSGEDPGGSEPVVAGGDLNGGWLDSELATISSGGPPTPPATKGQMRPGRQGARSRGRS